MNFPEQKEGNNHSDHGLYIKMNEKFCPKVTPKHLVHPLVVGGSISHKLLDLSDIRIDMGLFFFFPEIFFVVLGS